MTIRIHARHALVLLTAGAVLFSWYEQFVAGLLLATADLRQCLLTSLDATEQPDCAQTRSPPLAVRRSNLLRAFTRSLQPDI
jgi:hypothetical protein